MNVGTLFVKLALDSKEFKQALDAATKQATAFSRASNLKLNTNSLVQFSSSTMSLNRALASSLPLLTQLQNKLQHQQAQHAALSARLAATTQKHGAGSAAALTQQASLVKLNNSMAQTSAAIQQVQIATQKTTGVMGLLNTINNNAAAMFQRLAAASAVAAKALLAVAAAFAVVVTGGIVYSVREAANFEQAMADLAAVTLASSKEIAAFSAVALEMGRTTKFTASQAAEGLKLLSMAGFSTQGAIDALSGTLSLAAAANIDLDRAVNIAAAGVRAFGLVEAEASRVADVYAMTQANANTTLEQMGFAMKYVGPVAKMAGYSIESVSAAIGIMSDAGIRGEMAGTTLRQVILRMVAPTDAARAVMKEYGIEVRNMNGTMKDLPTILDEFNTKLAHLSLAQRDAAIKTLFNVESLGGFNAMLSRGSAYLRDFTEQNEKAGGTAEKMAEVQLNTLLGKITLFTSALSGLAITVGAEFLPALSAMVDTMTRVITAVTPVAQLVARTLVQFFEMIAGNARSWGQNIGDSFASGIISAAQSVVNALREMGRHIAYWLQPGSPPKIVPNLDIWGRDAAQVYLDSFLDADFTVLQQIGSIVKDILSSIVDTSIVKQQDIIPTVLGSRKAFQEVQSEVRKTGSITEEAIQRVIRASGAAQNIVEPLIRAYFNMTRASLNVADAQKVVAKAQERLSQVTKQYDGYLQPLYKSLEKISAAEEKINRQQRIKELYDIIHDTRSEAEKALDPITKQIQMIDRQQKKLSLEEDIAAYKEELANTDPEYQQEIALKLSRAELELQALILQDQIDLEDEHQEALDKKVEQQKASLELQRIQLEQNIAALEARKEQAELEAQKEIDDAIAEVEAAERMLEIAQEQFSLEEQKIAALKEQNALLEEQRKLVEGGDKPSGGGVRPEDTGAGSDAAREAQEAYNYALQDTDGKLAILRGRLAEVEVGSADYYRILGQVQSLEETRARELEASTKQAEADAAARTNAERNYNYQIADTAGKLNMLYQELGLVEEGGVEYYNILGQIATLEAQAAREAEKLGGAAGGAVGGGIAPLTDALGELGSSGDKAMEAMGILQGRLSSVRQVLDGATEGTRLYNVATGQVGALEASIANINTLSERYRYLQALLATTAEGTTEYNDITAEMALIQADVAAETQKANDNFYAYEMAIEEYGTQPTRNMGDALDDTGGKASFLSDLMQTYLIPVITGIGIALTALAIPALTAMATAVGTLLAPIAAAIAIGALLGAAWATNFGGIRDVTFQVLDLIKTQITAVLTVVKNFWDKHGDDVLSSTKGAWGAIEGAIGSVLQMIGFIIGAFVKLATFIVTEWGEEILLIISIAWDSIMTVITVAFRLIEGIFNVALALLKGDWKTAWEETKSTGEDIWTAIVGFFGRTWESIKEIILPALLLIKEALFTWAEEGMKIWLGMWTFILDKAQEIWDGIKAKFQEMVDYFKPTLQLGLDTLLGMLSAAPLLAEFVEGALAIGSSIIDGIANGISNGIQSVIDAARNAARAAFDAAMNFLDSSSPSKLFENVVGHSITEGMAKGIEYTAPVEKAMRKLIDITLPQVDQYGGASNQTTWNVNIQTQQSVPSILDGLVLRQALYR